MGKRLIDAELLTKQFLTRYTEREKQGNYTFVACEIKQDFADLMDEIPTVDAVEVVRCNNCKHWLKDVPGCTEFVGRCELANYMIGSTGFCSYGEMRCNVTNLLFADMEEIIDETD